MTWFNFHKCAEFLEKFQRLHIKENSAIIFIVLALITYSVLLMAEAMPASK